MNRKVLISPEDRKPQPISETSWCKNDCEGSIKGECKAANSSVEIRAGYLRPTSEMLYRWDNLSGPAQQILIIQTDSV